MRDILIVIHGMGCGGAEKSLVSFLKTLDNQQWNIDLLVMNPNGIFMKDIPKYVHRIDDLYEIENYLTPLEKRRKKVCSLRDLFCQVKWQFSKSFYKKSNLKYDEIRWKIWGKFLPKIKKKYDLAVSYMHGAPNYYVIDKVQADKKILWIHNEFEKIGFNKEFERTYFERADKVVTISQACVDNFVKVMPEMKEKTCVLENISSPTAINIMSGEEIDDIFFRTDKIKLLSVGRLNKQKGFDFAIDAANILKQQGLSFIWYILGEGDLRSELQNQIDKYGLQNEVILTGIKANPYPYISKCDVFVQSSRHEGKSIVLDEAKILCKPIVVTNYVTVGNSIVDRLNGKIVEINPESIANGILEICNDNEFRQSLIDELSSESNGNEAEINKYIDLFNQVMEAK